MAGPRSRQTREVGRDVCLDLRRGALLCACFSFRADGSATEFDAVVWCTGFHAHTPYLARAGQAGERLVVDEKGRLEGVTPSGQSTVNPRVFMHGWQWAAQGGGSIPGACFRAAMTAPSILQVISPARQ